MYLRHRQRRGVYPLAQESPLPRLLARLAALAVFLLLLYWIGSWILRLFGVGNALDREPATLYTEERGIVTVSLQKADAQPAENGMSLFPGDAIATGANARAAVHLFDGTWLRADQRTEWTLAESARGKEESDIAIELGQGQVWILTPPPRSFSGSIVRRVTAGTLRFDLPPDAEVSLSPTTLAVFSADGQGVTVTAKGIDAPFVIGEGQQWTMPSGVPLTGDPFAFRTPLGPNAISSFIADSRQKYQRALADDTGATTGEAVTITAPAANVVFTGQMITVRGTIGDQVQQVLVNGHEALVDHDKNTFSQQVAPDDEGDLELRVQAYDAAKTLLGDVRRTLKRQTTVAAAPTVTSPAKTGETYRTNAQELVLRGTSPAGAAGIMVNEYKLQLFNPEKGEWSYLASQSLGNLKPGTNIYDVTALDAAGKRSPAARLTIVLGEGDEGVVVTGGSSSASSKPALDPATLPKNDPLQPGTLKVTAPTPGESHAESGTGFLLEGTTSPDTATVWVNDYQLQLYKPGRKTWNYIASAEFGNLKKGTNVYRIVTRDEANKILDVLEYAVSYEPKQ